MRISKFILNEKEYAEYAIQNRWLSDQPVTTLNKVAKYYYKKGYRKSELPGLLENFLIQCNPEINILKWEPIIDQQTRIVEKYPLSEIDYITVSQNEFHIVKQLKGYPLQRLLFTLICLGKYSIKIRNKNGWINQKDKDIFKMANIQAPVKRQSLMINDLKKRGLIQYSRVVDNINIQVKCLNNGSSFTQIDDFRNLGNQYMKLCGQSFLACDDCGIVIKKVSNSQKYCKECGIEKNRISANQRWKAGLKP